MYLVESVKPLRKKKYLITIKTLKKSKEYEISEDILVEFRLVKDKTLSEKDFKAFEFANQRDVFYQKVLHYALYKIRCTKEITDYLTKKGIPSADFPFYLKKLKKNGVLDDLRYTEIYVRESFEFKKIGPKKITYELNKKSISKAMYEPFIKKIHDAEIEENLDYLFKKKLASIKHKSITFAKQSLSQNLINKGYNYDVVKAFIDKNNTLIQQTVMEDKSIQRDFELATKKYKDSINKTKNILAYLLRKGYGYSKIKETLGEKIYE